MQLGSLELTVRERGEKERRTGLEQKWPTRGQKRRGREKRSDREIKKVGQLVDLRKVYRAHRV